MVFFMACSQSGETPVKVPMLQESQDLPQDASHEKPLLIGLIPEQNIFKQFERYEPMAAYISKKIGRKVELKILTRYGNIVDNFVSLQLDGAFFGSFTYALAHTKLGLEVVARPEGLNGVSTYHGRIFVRKDSGIKDIEGMKGKSFVFVDKATTAGYLLPMVYFHKHGVFDYRSYFKETYFSGTHEDAIYDVLNRKADIGAAKNTIYDRLAKMDPAINRDLVILAESPEVPENGLALRSDLDATLRDKIKEVLLNMQDDPEGRAVLHGFGAGRFIATTTRDYDPVFRYAAEARLDWATYNYKNE
ncbi:MAG: phosphate/phosphite/phosphonate ABC transporter substrate-binding protein [bacterium]